ncbi:hypothetical protein QAD02_009638 [Eretmocerus hayati]|uniref:Uncharacterized protein n=1 Tax=Eretmocerus hayati TaxID=131215 RepID=A0ACC2N9X1_9HYME|nr:hypothetical protein QAD02_009638 [Eretmocerus hayati]
MTGKTGKRYSAEGENQQQQRPMNFYNLFAIYAKVFRLLLGSRPIPPEETEYAQALDALVLPSNEQWRLTVYYGLVELQRETDLQLAEAHEDDQEWVPYLSDLY